MAVVRILLVSILAAVAACVAASLILFGYLNRWSFVPLIFALPGSVLLLAPGYAALKERGLPIMSRYLSLLALGAVAGALMLGFVSMLNAEGALLGGFYGATTAASWIALHFASKRGWPANS